jgi:hypothetical protein
MDEKPYRETLVFRGKTYVLEELSIGEFEDIEKQATRTEFDSATETNREVLDGVLQNQLLMQAMLVEGLPAGGLRKIPTIVMVNLRRRLNDMLFGELKNEFEVPANAKGKNGSTPEVDEEEDKGEG